MTIGQAIENALKIRDKYRKTMGGNVEIEIGTFMESMKIRVLYWKNGAEEYITMTEAFDMRFVPPEHVLVLAEEMFRHICEQAQNAILMKPLPALKPAQKGGRNV